MHKLVNLQRAEEMRLPLIHALACHLFLALHGDWKHACLVEIAREFPHLFDRLALVDLGEHDLGAEWKQMSDGNRCLFLTLARQMVGSYEQWTKQGIPIQQVYENDMGERFGWAVKSEISPTDLYNAEDLEIVRVNALEDLDAKAGVQLFRESGCLGQRQAEHLLRHDAQAFLGRMPSDCNAVWFPGTVWDDDGHLHVLTLNRSGKPKEPLMITFDVPHAHHLEGACVARPKKGVS